MRKMGSISALALAGLVGIAAAARADDVPGVYATGVSEAGVVVVAGTADPHWNLVEAADTNLPLPNAAIVATNDRAHLANDAVGATGSSWVATTSYTGAWVPAGRYAFETTIDLTGFESSTAVFAGRLASDNSVIDLVVNGVSLGSAGGAFNRWTDFQIDSELVDGANTFTFVVQNFSVGPMGFRVEWSGTADPATVEAPVIEAEVVTRPLRRAHVFFPRSWSSVPVAVLSTESFDATTLDPATVDLSGAGVSTRLVYKSWRSWFCARTAGSRASWRTRVCDGVDAEPEIRYRAYPRDVNGDGRADLVMRFRFGDLVLDPGTTALDLTGLTSDGTEVAGSVEISVD
jgi:hypothetical protein